jgi:hypothetical protein
VGDGLSKAILISVDGFKQKEPIELWFEELPEVRRYGGKKGRHEAALPNVYRRKT